MADKQVEISSLNLLVGKREISLTLEEAKKLKKALDDLFGKEVHEHHFHTKEVVKETWPYNYWRIPTGYYGSTSADWAKGIDQYKVQFEIRRRE